MAKKKQEYGNESIVTLKGADRVRKRPAVIFGSDGIEGCQHSVFEILSNSIDEAREGYGNNIIVTRYEDKSVEIEDFGNPELLARAFVVDGGVEVANVDPRFVYATLMASKSLFVGIAQPLDESGSVSDPLVFINLIDSGVSWKGTYSELADR